MRKKCIKLSFSARFCLLLVLSVLCSFILVPKTASAYDFGATASRHWATGTSKYTSTSASSAYLWNGGQVPGSFFTYYAVNNNGDALWILNDVDVGSAGSLQSLGLKMGGSGSTSSPIPAGALFSFSVRYAGLAGSSLRYGGAVPPTNSNRWYLVNDSCFANADIYSNTTNSNFASDMVCTYYGYTDHELSTIHLGLYVNYEANGIMIISKGVSWVEVSDSSGGDSSSTIISDLQTIIGKIETNNTQNTYINYNIEDIKDILEEMGETSEASAEAVQQLVQQNEDDRQELEDNVQEAQDTADEQGAESEQTGQTLIGAFSAFVTALTNVQPGNCVINANLGRMNLGNINLCTLNPPPAFQTIASIVLIAFVVPLSIALVKKMISLFRSFQNG